MKPPKTQKQYVLKMLIENKNGVSERGTNFNGYRMRISEIRRVVPLIKQVVPFVNSMGKKSHYGVYKLARKDVRAAKQYYKTLQEK